MGKKRGYGAGAGSAKKASPKQYGKKGMDRKGKKKC